MKKVMLGICVFLQLCNADAQTYFTRNGFIGFYSKTPLEDIKAENRQVYAVIDAGSKRLAFTLLLKGFLFPKKLMQQHFNENYVESDKYPKASFTGNYSGNVDVDKNGIYPVTVNGQMTLHGVTKNIEVPATIEIMGDKIKSNAAFAMIPSDYNIKIPSLVRDKIAKTIDVKVSVECNKK